MNTKTPALTCILKDIDGDKNSDLVGTTFTYQLEAPQLGNKTRKLSVTVTHFLLKTIDGLFFKAKVTSPLSDAYVDDVQSMIHTMSTTAQIFLTLEQQELLGI